MDHKSKKALRSKPRGIIPYIDQNSSLKNSQKGQRASIRLVSADKARSIAEYPLHNDAVGDGGICDMAT